MGYKYVYPLRSLFRERLIESGLSPESASSYETAVLDPLGSNYPSAKTKWLKLMDGEPLPVEYEYEARILEYEREEQTPPVLVANSMELQILRKLIDIPGPEVSAALDTIRGIDFIDTNEKVSLLIKFICR